jgi:dTDP-4-amino-4,6-dideoxygalactose transaminase
MIAPLRSEIRLTDLIRSLFRNQGHREKLEGELTAYFGVPDTLLTHSARSGIYFLLKALPQKKVYLPAYNCWAVTEAALYAGKELEYVDISLDDFNMDLAKLKESLEPGSIILATHQFGIPCEIEAMLDLARERNCVVIEDNAAAFGAEVRGRKTGSFGSAGILSFDYSKTVVSGKGGAILFNDPDLHAKVRALQERETRAPSFLKTLKFALLPFAYRYGTHRLSYPLSYALFPQVRGGSRSEARCDLGPENESYHLSYDDLRAKLAWCSLQRVSETIALRRQVTDLYRREIAAAGIDSPVVRDGNRAAMVKYPIRVKNRQAFYDRCVAKGVDLGFLFQFHYSGSAPCPNAEAAAREGIGLPVYGALRENDLRLVKEAVMQGAGE